MTMALSKSMNILVVQRESLSSERITPSRSVFCRILEPLTYLNTTDEQYKITALSPQHITQSQIDKNDILIFCKHNTKMSLDILKRAKASNKKIVYDIDDLIYKFTTDSIAYKHMENVAYLKAHIELSDHIVISTEYLATHILTDFNIQAHSIINMGINTDKHFKKHYSPDANGVIFTNGDNIKLNKYRGDFFNAFNDFQKAACSTIDIFGDNEEYLSDLKNYNFLGARPWDEHKRHLIYNNYKFAIIPLGDEEEDPIHQEFSKCKSPIKYLEYGATKIPGIYSKATIYTDSVKHRITGIITENDYNSWYEALSELNASPILRQRIARNAFEDVRENHHISIASKKWLNLLYNL